MIFDKQQLFFVGGYAPADKPGIHCFRFDAATGALVSLCDFSGIENPSFLVVHPNGRWVYAVSEMGLGSNGRYGSVWALHFDRDALSFQELNHQTTKGDWPCHLQIDASGRWLAASNYGTGNAALYPIQSDGSLGEMSSFVQHEGHGPNQSRQEGPHAHSTTFTPDNQFAIVADLGIDQLVIYKFDAKTGQLNLHGQAQAQPGAGPRHLAFHPNGTQVYVANELNNTVSLYDYNGIEGTLKERQTLDTLPPNAPENTVADIHISPSGQHIYVSNRGHQSVAIYEIGENGHLILLGISSCNGKGPRNFAISPNGRFILVANRFSNDISVLPMLADGAQLGLSVAQVSFSQPSCIRWAARV